MFCIQKTFIVVGGIQPTGSKIGASRFLATLIGGWDREEHDAQLIDQYNICVFVGLDIGGDDKTNGEKKYGESNTTLNFD